MFQSTIRSRHRDTHSYLRRQRIDHSNKRDSEKQHREHRNQHANLIHNKEKTTTRYGHWDTETRAHTALNTRDVTTKVPTHTLQRPKTNNNNIIIINDASRRKRIAIYCCFPKERLEFSRYLLASSASVFTACENFNHFTCYLCLKRPIIKNFLSNVLISIEGGREKRESERPCDVQGRGRRRRTGDRKGRCNIMLETFFIIHEQWKKGSRMIF